MDEALELAKEGMEEAIDRLRKSLTKVRAGRANPAMLDGVRVDNYGSMMPLNQVATVSVGDARLLVIKPWDRNMIGPVEKAINAQNLGLNPQSDGVVIRLAIPPLTEERRKEYVRMLHKLAEEGRVNVRHARKDANDEVKHRQKDEGLSEDDIRREQGEVQKLTDQFIAKIEEMLKHKEAEVMEV
jgi:ribosome recycling factor